MVGPRLRPIFQTLRYSATLWRSADLTLGFDQVELPEQLSHFPVSDEVGGLTGVIRRGRAGSPRLRPS